MRTRPGRQRPVRSGILCPIVRHARRRRGLPERCPTGDRACPAKITVHEIDVPHDRRVVLSCIDDVDFPAANQRASSARTAELFCLFQARDNRGLSKCGNGVRQRIKHAYFEALPTLRSEVLIRRPSREFCDSLRLAGASDDRLRLLPRAALALAWLSFRLLL